MKLARFVLMVLLVLDAQAAESVKTLHKKLDATTIDKVSIAAGRVGDVVALLAARGIEVTAGSVEDAPIDALTLEDVSAREVLRGVCARAGLRYGIDADGIAIRAMADGGWQGHLEEQAPGEWRFTAGKWSRKRVIQPNGEILQEGHAGVFGYWTIKESDLIATFADGARGKFAFPPENGLSKGKSSKGWSVQARKLALPADAPGGVELPTELRSAICTISGDGGSGTGFVALFKDRPVVVTNQHVILGQKNLTITNLDGKTLKPIGGALAQGVDVVLLTLAAVPEGIKPFTLSKDMNEDAEEGDLILIVGNSLGGGTLPTTAGRIKSIGPRKIEHTAPTFKGNSGSPIYHVDSGKVLGVDTESVRSLAGAGWGDKASARKSGAAVGGDGVRLFGHRMDTEKSWSRLDWQVLSKTTAQINKVVGIGSDALLVLRKGKYGAISDPVMRESFTKARKIWKDPKMSDMDAYNHFIRAVDSMRSSLAYNMKRLEQEDACFVQKESIETLSPTVAKIVEALDVVKADIKTARSIYAGKYVMPSRIKSILGD